MNPRPRTWIRTVSKISGMPHAQSFPHQVGMIKKMLSARVAILINTSLPLDLFTRDPGSRGTLSLVHSKWFSQTAVLVDPSRSLPVNQVRQPPGILVQIPLQLALF